MTTATRTTGEAAAIRTYLGLELNRLLRNRRSVLLTFLLPPLFFLIFRGSTSYQDVAVGTGTNALAYVMVSMALYGALTVVTSGAAGVAAERAQGWTRQLRVTPLSPWSYVLVKVLASMALGAVAVVLTFVIGWYAGAQMPVATWIACGLIAVCGSFVFAAFGLFMGYLLPTENLVQVLSPIVLLLSFAGGLIIPVSADSWFAGIAPLMPTYGVGELVRAPLAGGGVPQVAVVNAVAWALIFVAGAVWRFRRDTARM
ncbi:ABC transporter permease [Promicromonospora soli]